MWMENSNKQAEIFAEDTITGAIKSPRFRWAGPVVGIEQNRISRKAQERYGWTAVNSWHWCQSLEKSS